MRVPLILAALILTSGALAAPDEDATQTKRLEALRTVQSFDCRNVSCKRLRSCAEACFKLLQCGQTVRDGDNDGIPCENLCSRRC